MGTLSVWGPLRQLGSHAHEANLATKDSPQTKAWFACWTMGPPLRRPLFSQRSWLSRMTSDFTRNTWSSKSFPLLLFPSFYLWALSLGPMYGALGRTAFPTFKTLPVQKAAKVAQGALLIHHGPWEPGFWLCLKKSHWHRVEAGFGEGQGGPREPIVGLLTALVRYNWVLDDSRWYQALLLEKVEGGFKS